MTAQPAFGIVGARQCGHDHADRNTEAAAIARKSSTSSRAHSALKLWNAASAESFAPDLHNGTESADPGRSIVLPRSC